MLFQLPKDSVNQRQCVCAVPFVKGWCVYAGPLDKGQCVCVPLNKGSVFISFYLSRGGALDKG